ncbi:hypothetical protein BEL04_21525 [Mucilaginibacter sp. PPCGB 2223]|uniref:hypothetical protein n=1 Tax=Mucilaginibacter sp. PPCGB 2223 TaxID=1886027 RepID=UPI000825B343|nr:hypothetical protein [Mucilaginibacter sp. PPCGB 2223]OCX50369.1 hypothetical protein BEL04_21525 [Mucilaginibacter sp. PPCGB 2223]
MNVQPQTPYEYKFSQEYIRQLEFDYLETYSFQRGEVFELELENNRARFRALNDSQNKRTPDEEMEFRALLSRPVSAELLIDDNEQMHLTAVKTGSFPKLSREATMITNILKMEALNVPAWMCAPMYRDAIVFYDANGKRASVLNICFSCEYMATGKSHLINADSNVYSQLKNLLINIGHAITE